MIFWKKNDGKTHVIHQGTHLVFDSPRIELDSLHATVATFRNATVVIDRFHSDNIVLQGICDITINHLDGTYTLTSQMAKQGCQLSIAGKRVDIFNL